MKKVLIFIGIVIILFVALTIVTNISKEQKVEGNPYGKETLDPATINQLDNPDYQNLILPNELDERLTNKEDFVVYYYSPTCPACVQGTPIINEVASDMIIDVKQFNLLEFPEGFRNYDIKETPTLLYYENGEEASRIVGITEEYVSDLEAFFESAK